MNRRGHIGTMALGARGGLALLLAVIAAAPALADDATLAPSGYQVTLHEVLDETQPFDGTRQLVVRLVAPAIATPVTAPNLQADMQWACETWGLPEAANHPDPPDKIIVEMMAAPVARGVPSPDTTRFFESFTLENGACIWSLF